jgi:hypothetical protein
MKQFLTLLLLMCMTSAAITPAQTGAGSQGSMGCVVGSACKSAITPQNINGELNEEAFSGGSIAERVNAALVACGTTTPCVILLPSYAPSGIGWKMPLPNNVLLDDRRSLNSEGFASGTAPNLRSHAQYNISLGTDITSFEEDEAGSGRAAFDAEVSAHAGGHIGDGGRANGVAGLFYAERTGGSRPVWGIDINVQCHNNNNFCNALELDSVNWGPADDLGATQNGLLVIASGPKNLGTGVTIQGSGSNWKYGQVIQSYSAVGQKFLPSAGRIADVTFTPPADDANLELLGRNAADTRTVWSIDDSGNFNGASFNGRSVGVGPANWETGTSDPTGTCQTGSLFSNTAGAAGHVFWVCVASGWVDIK